MKTFYQAHDPARSFAWFLCVMAGIFVAGAGAAYVIAWALGMVRG